MPEKKKVNTSAVKEKSANGTVSSKKNGNNTTKSKKISVSSKSNPQTKEKAKNISQQGKSTKKSATNKKVVQKVANNSNRKKNQNKDKETVTSKVNKLDTNKKKPVNIKKDNNSKTEVKKKSKVTTLSNVKVEENKQLDKVATKEKKKFSIRSLFAKKSTSKSRTEKKASVKKPKKTSKAQKNRVVFSAQTKKWLILVAVICLLILVAEGIYVIVHRMRVEQHTTYYDSLNSVVVDDTDIVAVGSSHFKYSKYYDYTKGLEKAKLVKYDKDGKLLFEKMYEKGINTTFSSVIAVDDGYVVVGSGVFSEEEQQDEAREAFIIKYDKEGNILWEKYYQVVTNTRFNKVIETADGYIAIGQSIYANMEMGNHTTGGGIIVKYDFDGNEIWHNNHGGMKSGNFNDIVEVDGNFYVVGKDATDSANLVKYDKDGKYLWHKNYSYTDSIGFTGIAYLNDYLYVVGSKKVLPEGTGDEDDRNTTNTDALFVQYDLDGNIKFEKTFGGSNYERYNSILAYHNNLYVVGHTTSSDAGLKTETDGVLMTGLVVRYDCDGNILKKEVFGGSNNDNLTDITTDGVSLYISGYSNSKNGNITSGKDNGKDYFGKIIKIDSKFRTLMMR